MKHLILYLALVLTTGCLQKFKTQPVVPQQFTAETLGVACQEMNHVGNVKNLAKRIEQKVYSLNRLLDDVDYYDENVISLRAQEIQELAARLMQLLDKKYTDAKYQQNLVWNVKFKDVVFHPSDKPWTNYKVRLDGAYDWSGDLYRPNQYVNVGPGQDNSFEVNFTRTVSLLELCQFQNTINLIARVEARNEQQASIIKVRLVSKKWGEI